MNPRREAAHALLDAVSAFDPDKGDTPENEAAVQLALDRLDMSPGGRAEAVAVLAAALDLLVTTIYQIAESKDVDPQVVMSAIRTHMDQAVYGHPHD